MFWILLQQGFAADCSGPDATWSAYGCAILRMRGRHRPCCRSAGIVFTKTSVRMIVCSPSSRLFAVRAKGSLRADLLRGIEMAVRC